VDDEPVEREDNPVLAEIEFNGEVVSVYGQSERAKELIDSDQAILRTPTAGLPYTVNGTKQYFRATVIVELDFGEVIPEDCQELPEQVAVAMAESLRSNEVNTAEQYINDNWENQP